MHGLDPCAVTAAAPKAGPADLHDADQGRGVHRPGPGLLRGALPRASAVVVIVVAVSEWNE